MRWEWMYECALGAQDKMACGMLAISIRMHYSIQLVVCGSDTVSCVMMLILRITRYTNASNGVNLYGKISWNRRWEAATLNGSASIILADFLIVCAPLPMAKVLRQLIVGFGGLSVQFRSCAWQRSCSMHFTHNSWIFVASESRESSISIRVVFCFFFSVSTSTNQAKESMRCERQST